MSYFKNIQSLDDLKEQFKKLARKHHPDAGGNAETMKEINREYDILFPVWKHRYNALSAQPTEETSDSTRNKFYSDNGWEGEKHDWNRDIKDVAALIRNYVKEIYPTYKFSVRIHRYSMGQTLYTDMVEAPHDIYKTREELNLKELNEIYRKLKANDYYNGEELGGEEFDQALEKAWKESNFYKVYNEQTQAMIDDIEREVRAYNYEDIDSMTDYYHVDFHYSGVKVSSDLKIVEKQARVKAKESTENNDNHERYQIKKSTHTKTGEDIYLVKIVDTLEREEFLEEKQKLKEMGGYYSKYTHSFVFKEDPSDKLNKNSINIQKNVNTQEDMSEEDIYNNIFEYEMLIGMPEEERITLRQRGTGWNLEKANKNIQDYAEYARNCKTYLKENLFQINTCEEVSYYLLDDLARYNAHPHYTVSGVKIEKSDTNSITFKVSGYEHDDGSYESYSETKTWTLNQINEDLKAICLTHYWKDKKIKYLKEKNQIKMIGKLEDKFAIPENDRLTQRYRSPYEDINSNKNKNPDEIGYVLRSYTSESEIERKYEQLLDMDSHDKTISTEDKIDVISKENIENSVSSNNFELKQVSVRLNEEATLYSSNSIQTAEDAVEIVGKELLSQLDREQICIINLDTAKQPINFSIVSVGTLNQALSEPREMLKASILSNAGSVILLHNHVSGSLSPSSQDYEMTKRMIESFEIVGIKVLDHIIIGGNNKENFYSMREDNNEMFENYKVNGKELKLTDIGEKLLHEVPVFLVAEDLAYWVNNTYTTISLENNEAELLLDYMDGHGYNLGVDGDNLVRIDAENSGNEIIDYNIESAIYDVCDWNSDLQEETSENLNKAYSVEEVYELRQYMKGLKNDEELLEKMFVKTTLGKTLDLGTESSKHEKNHEEVAQKPKKGKGMVI